MAFRVSMVRLWRRYRLALAAVVIAAASGLAGFFLDTTIRPVVEPVAKASGTHPSPLKQPMPLSTKRPEQPPERRAPALVQRGGYVGPWIVGLDRVAFAAVAWVGLGAAVVGLGILARRRKRRALALKLGLCVAVVAFLLAGAPGVNLAGIGLGLGLLGFLSLLAMLGAWEHNQPVVTFIRAYTARKARRGFTLALLLGTTALMCFYLAAGNGATFGDLLREARASLANLFELRWALGGLSPLKLIEGGTVWSLFSIFTSSATYGLFFAAATIIAFAWAMTWFVLGGSVVLTHRIILFQRQRRIAAAVTQQQAYGTARVATPEDVAATRFGMADGQPRRRFAR